MERFDAETALALIERYAVTHSQWVPTMFVKMLKLSPEQRDSYDVSSMRAAIHASAPCPIEVKYQMIDWWGPILYEYYGGTEGNGFVSCDTAEWLAHPGTVGHPANNSVHITDDAGVELGAREAGTVWFESATEFEYHNDEEKTLESRDPLGRGWTTLGDVGFLDQDRYLHLTDRKAHMIITGGVNVYPQEVENVLTLHPKVLDVAVIGVPNEEFGEEVKAVVQLMRADDAGRALEQELIQYCRQRLAPVKCPRSIDFREDLPRYPTGKLVKRLLKDEYWAVRR
jgi:acyl-CoA synthetase (AMP-forming)/AMP-acid ligase II